MHKIMVLNAKGGCGKTTIATNLANYFTGLGYTTALMDYDPQGSSSRWLKLRSQQQRVIRSIDASRPATGVTRTWQLHTGTETEIVIIDTPAGVTGAQLMDLFHRADTILIPVLPSIVDFYAVEQFLDEMMRLAKHRIEDKRLAMIANRVRTPSKSNAGIKLLAEQSGIPLIASLRDTQNYPRAMAVGQGVSDLNARQAAKDHTQWRPIIEWLYEKIPDKPSTGMGAAGNSDAWTRPLSRAALP